MHTLPTTPLFGDKTPEMNKKLILECLEDKKIGTIGVYGIGGVGKTTLMKHINNHLEDKKLFDGIIWVTVSKDCSLKRLQDGIAKEIGLALLDDRDEGNRSRELHEALLRRKNFVLILDDMWEAFSLEDLGIPQPNEDNGCKIVLTTRSQNVCNRMETQREINVKALSEEESWALFSSKVDNDVLLSADIKEVAKIVAEECGGLPLALITVGRALRKVNDVRVWRNAVNELRDSAHQEMQDKVFKHLKFSYVRLSDENVRACFLYCSLFPEDCEIPVEDLINFWIWEGFINDFGNEEREKDKAYSILDELKCACMLGSGHSYYPYVKMHDLIRDMAIGITRDSPRFMVKARLGLKEQPKDEEWVEDIERISLSWNKFPKLSGQPKLLTLFLNSNGQLSCISPSFFHNMHGLGVLDLSFTSIESLPESLSDLVNLRALLLHDSKELVDVPSLAKLKELRMLNLSKTRIKELPQGMEGLVNLRSLDLSETGKLKMVRAGIIPKLSLLEDLQMHRSLWRWNMINAEGVSGINEIIELKQMHTLSMHVEDLSTFLIYVRSPAAAVHCRRLQSFTFFIGEYYTHVDQPNVVVIANYGVDNSSKGISLLLPDNTSHLEIINCSGIVVLSQFLLEVRASIVCKIESCDDMEYIFAGGENSLLSSIETLTLLLMSKLGAISQGVMPNGSLACLKALHIQECHMLRYVLSLGLFQSLQNLEEISVSGCNLMEEIIAGKGEHPGVLPSLKKLCISFCPKLKSLFSSNLCQCLQNLEEISVFRCNLMEEIIAGKGEHPGVHLSLKSLYICACPKLKNLFSSNLCQSLQNLEEITLKSCNEIEQIIAEEEEEKGLSEIREVNYITREANELPKLQLLRLKLPKLKCICKRVLICNSLQEVKLSSCPQLKNLLLSMENPTSTVNGFIKGTREWWDALEWNNPNTKTMLQHLFKLIPESDRE